MRKKKQIKSRINSIYFNKKIPPKNEFLRRDRGERLFVILYILAPQA